MSNSLTIQELQSLLDSIAHVKESKELATLGNATSCHSVTLRSLCQQLLAALQREVKLRKALEQARLYAYAHGQRIEAVEAALQQGEYTGDVK